MDKPNMSKTAKRKVSKKVNDSDSTTEVTELSKSEIARKNSKDLLQRRISILKRDLKIKEMNINNSKLVPGATATSAAKSFRKKSSGESVTDLHWISRPPPRDARDSSMSVSDTSQIATGEKRSDSPQKPFSSLWEPITYISVNMIIPAKKFLQKGKAEKIDETTENSRSQPQKSTDVNSDENIPMVSNKVIRKKSKPKLSMKIERSGLNNDFATNAQANNTPTATDYRQRAPSTAGNSQGRRNTAGANLTSGKRGRRSVAFELPKENQHYKRKRHKARVYGSIDDAALDMGSTTASHFALHPRAFSEAIIKIDPATFKLIRFSKSESKIEGDACKLKFREKRPLATPPKDNVKKWFTGYFFISTSSDNVGIRPDKSWLIKYDREDEDSGQNQAIPDENRSCFMLAFLPYWLSLFLTGRLPFYFEYDRRQKNYVCQINSNDVRFRHFLLSSIAIFFTCLLYNYSLLCMFIEVEVEELPPYSQLELLLLDKHWVSMIVHETKLILAAITSLNILRSGAGIATFITDFDSSCKKLHYDPYKGVTIYPYIDVLSSVGTTVVTCLFFHFNICGLKESVELNTIIYFRPFFTELYFSWYFPYLCWVVILIQVYMLFCAKSFIHMLVFYCIAVRNLAEQWNMQVAQFICARGGHCTSLEKNVNIGHTDVKPNELKSTHEMLFDYYITIGDLVRGASKRFSTIVLVYYCILVLTSHTFYFTILDFTFAALSLGTIFTQRRHEEKFNETAINFLKPGHHIVYVEHSARRFAEVLYYLTLTTIGFTFTTTSISSVGETIMRGSDVIRKFNLMSSKTAKDRRFILSMEMCFSRNRRPGIRPGGYFRIDREFRFNLLAAALFLTSLMIQLNLEPFITQPIVFSCNTSTSGICLGVVNKPESDANVHDIKHNFMQMVPGPPPPPPPIIPAPPMQPSDPLKRVDNLVKQSIIFIPPSISISIIPHSVILRDIIPDSETYDELCKEFCPGTLVHRIVMYDEAFNRIPLPTDAEQCVFAPYVKIGKEKVTDCIGVDAGEVDECGIYQLNPHYSSPTTVRESLSLIPIAVEGQFSPIVGCFEVRDNSQPLELAQIPYTAIVQGTLFQFRPSSTHPGPSVFSNLQLPELLRFEPDRQLAALACKVETFADKSIKDPLTGSLTDYYKDIGNPPTFYVRRPYALSFRRDVTTGYQLLMQKIPFPPDACLMEQLVRPYAYLPPKLLQNKAYGYYDCFGYQLLEFDDCGYLPFSRVVQENGVWVRKTPEKELVVLADRRQYKCWESWTEEYMCGVPPEYVGFVCDKWKEYRDKDF